MKLIAFCVCSVFVFAATPDNPLPSPQQLKQRALARKRTGHVPACFTFREWTQGVARGQEYCSL